jgi:hypothetical protein
MQNIIFRTKIFLMEDPLFESLGQHGPLECLMQIVNIVRNSSITEANLEEIQGHAINWLTMAHSHMVLFDALDAEEFENDANAQIALYYRYGEALFALDDRTLPGIMRTYQQKLQVLDNVVLDLRKVRLIQPYDASEFKQNPVHTKTMKLINRISSAFYSYFHLLYHTQRLHFMRFSETSELIPFEMIVPYKDSPVEKSDVLRVTDFMLHQLCLMGAVRMNRVYVMKPRFTAGNFKSGSYEVFCQLDQLQNKLVDKQQHLNIYEILASGRGNIFDRVKSNLMEFKHVEFPDLCVNRMRFSFANGIYDAENDMFRPYGQQDRCYVNFLTEPFRHNPDPKGGPVHMYPFALRNTEDYDRINDVYEGAAVGSQLFTWKFGSSSACQQKNLLLGTSGLDSECSAKYFDMPFPEHLMGCDDPMTMIPTPSLDKVFEAQELGPATNPLVLEWIYALMGRMLRQTGDDNWQICPFFKGVAGTGKSTVLKVLQQFYNTEEVGVLSNNVEAQFGLAPLVDKKIVLCMELRNDFRLSQAELQTMISGEDMSMAQKHKEPIVMRWNVPLAFAGNTLGAWADGQGSIARRFVIINFPKPVVAADAMLDQRIKEEMPAIMLKCNIMYLRKKRALGGHDFWTKKLDENGQRIVPSYFEDRRKELDTLVNSFAAFLAAGGVIEYGCDENGTPYYIEWIKLKAAYKRWCQEASIRQILNLENQENTQKCFQERALRRSETDPSGAPCVCLLGAKFGLEGEKLNRPVDQRN